MKLLVSENCSCESFREGIDFRFDFLSRRLSLCCQTGAAFFQRLVGFPLRLRYEVGLFCQCSLPLQFLLPIGLASRVSYCLFVLRGLQFGLLEPLAGIFQPAFDQFMPFFKDFIDRTEKKATQDEIKGDQVENRDRDGKVDVQHFLLWETEARQATQRKSVQTLKNSIGLTDCQQVGRRFTRGADFNGRDSGIAELFQKSIGIVRLAKNQETARRLRVK